MNQGLTLEIERVLPVASGQVFEACVSGDRLARWFGPEGFVARPEGFPARVGESYRIEMRPPDGDPFQINGEFREVDPPARLAFTFRYQPPDPDDTDTLVELELRPARDSTAVTLRHGPFKTEQRLELHRDGWGESFDRLQRLLSDG